MELADRLDLLTEKLKSLVMERNILAEENTDLREQLDQMKVELHRQTAAINNLEEQNKSAKLAGGQNVNLDNSGIKDELNALIKEIDQCINLVKR